MTRRFLSWGCLFLSPTRLHMYAKYASYLYNGTYRIGITKYNVTLLINQLKFSGPPPKQNNLLYHRLGIKTILNAVRLEDWTKYNNTIFKMLTQWSNSTLLRHINIFLTIAGAPEKSFWIHIDWCITFRTGPEISHQKTNFGPVKLIFRQFHICTNNLFIFTNLEKIVDFL